MPQIPDPDLHDLDSTQPGKPVTPPPPPLGHARPSLPARREKPKRKPKRDDRLYADPPPPRARSRSDSGLYLPVWSVMLMLVVVLVIAFGIVALVLALGGNLSPAGAPRIVIITAVPSNTPTLAQAPPPLPTAPGDAASTGDLPLPTFYLEGPTLVPVVLSPTPENIAVGKFVRATIDGVNVRASPGRSTEALFQANRGESFEVIDGPTTAENLTWWQIRDTNNSSRVGWAAENNGEQDLLEVAVQTP